MTGLGCGGLLLIVGVGVFATVIRSEGLGMPVAIGGLYAALGLVPLAIVGAVLWAAGAARGRESRTPTSRRGSARDRGRRVARGQPAARSWC